MKLIIAIIGIIGVMLIVAAARSKSAFAQWPPKGFFSETRQPRANVRRVRRHRYRHRHHRRRVIVRRRHVSQACRSEMTIVGDQSPTLNGARAQALKAYQQEARFRHGERFADPRNAAGVRFECVRSSIKNIANRATAAIGIDTQLERCSVTATPCRAPAIAGAAD